MIRDWIQRQIPVEAHDAAWHEATLDGLNTLNSSLQGDYHVFGSEHFYFFVPRNYEQDNVLSEFSASLYGQITSQLAKAAQRNWPGKLPILLIADDTAYYEYMTAFFPAGNNGGSGGMCVTDENFAHLVLNRLL